MNYRRYVFFVGTIWELARFVAIFLSIVSQLGDTRVSLVRILWFGSSQLALALGFLMLGANPGRYANLCRLLAAAKIATLVPGVALVIILLPGIRLAMYAGPEFAAILALSVPLLVLVIDIIFLVILLTYRMEDTPRSSAPDLSSRDDRLPDYHETDVEDN